MEDYNNSICKNRGRGKQEYIDSVWKQLLVFVKEHPKFENLMLSLKYNVDCVGFMPRYIKRGRSLNSGPLWIIDH